MTPRIKYIRGRLQKTLPELRGAFVAAAKKASWPKMLGALSLVALMTIGLSIFAVSRSFHAERNPVSSDNDVPLETAVNRDPLTGLKLAAPLEHLPQVFAVMVENSYEAWPLSGLDQAFLVIEAPVEGNIPRFVTFFEEGEDVKKIGPVRSARPYYLDWADEFAALYAHVGGSPEALDLISTNKTTKDLNEFSQGEYFWRDNVARFAPHNAYTSTDLLTDALTEVGRSTREYTSWLFAEATPSGEEISPTIDWESGSTYDVTWRYDKATNTYQRLQGTSPVKTSAGTSILANNVVVLETDITVVDALGRRHARTTGEGKAMLYNNGTKVVATWKKPTRTDRLRFYDATGNEVTFVPGKTWIEVIPDITNVSEAQPKAPVVSGTDQQSDCRKLSGSSA
jgi:hypothetical protein